MATLITGASSGLGTEFARLAAADGSDVVLVARSADKLDLIAKTLTRDHRVKAIVLTKDLSRPESTAEIVAELAAQSIEVDTLVNNAGFGTSGRFAETSLDDERQMIDVNVTALTLLTKRLLPAMVARRRGRILNVASTAAFQPGPYMAVYYATKAYVLWLSEALAAELEGTGVSVTCLCPGPTATAFQGRAGMERSRLFTIMRPAEPAAVARQGYDAMKAGRRVVIPGASNKIGAQAVRLFPRRLVAAVVGRMNSPAP